MCLAVPVDAMSSQQMALPDVSALLAADLAPLPLPAADALPLMDRSRSGHREARKPLPDIPTASSEARSTEVVGVSDPVAVAPPRFDLSGELEGLGVDQMPIDTVPVGSTAGPRGKGVQGLERRSKTWVRP